LREAFIAGQPVLLNQQTARGGPWSRFLQQRIDSYRSDAGSMAGLNRSHHDSWNS
jgi:hypothetical protein